MISVQSLANSILKRAFSEGINVTPMKLQKLLYFIYRDYLQSTGEPLFGENFQVWKYGPVLSSIYDEFKSFHGNNINRFGRNAEGKVLVIKERVVPDVSASLNKVWSKYKGYDGITLSRMTHQPGTAWYKAREHNNVYLDLEDIKNESCS